MNDTLYNIKAKIWLWEGKGAWHFVTIPKLKSKKIHGLFHSISGGWGSLPVKVTISHTSWQTSMFYDSKSSTYLLPIKAEIRKKESITEGDIITLNIQIQPSIL